VRHRLILAAATAVLALGLGVGTAGASIYSQVLRAYETHGSIPPCQFTSPQLQSALKGIDTYGAQYFADFTNAVQDALASRAAGACAPRTKRPAAAGAGAATRGGPAQPLKLGPLTGATGSSLPAPMLMLAAFGALLGLGAAVAGLARWRGWSPRWARAWGHAWSEAGYRAGGAWRDFEDWLRSG
jgi:hypothetical protein